MLGTLPALLQASLPRLPQDHCSRDRKKMALAEVGARVRVCHSDGYWYYGTLESKDEKKNKYTVAFDDGDRIVSALPHRDIQVLAAGLVTF